MIQYVESHRDNAQSQARRFRATGGSAFSGMVRPLDPLPHFAGVEPGLHPG